MTRLQRGRRLSGRATAADAAAWRRTWPKATDTAAIRNNVFTIESNDTAIATYGAAITVLGKTPSFRSRAHSCTGHVVSAGSVRGG